MTSALTKIERCLTFVIFDETNVVKASWQNYWPGTVTIGGQQLTWLPFDASGIFRGHVSGQGSTSVGLPATQEIWNVCLGALASSQQLMGKLQLYEFEGIHPIPPATMTLVGTTRGQLVNVSNSPVHTLRLELGTALSTTGAMIPWRTATSRIIGPGMRG